LCKGEFPNTTDYFYSRKNKRYPNGSRIPRVMPHCIKCHIKKSTTWGKNNREKLNAAQRKRWVEHKYGVSREQWETWLVQGCGLCHKPFELKTNEHNKRIVGGLNPTVDHDHLTGKVRGLLHSKCNSAVGLLDDDPQKALLAYQYLLKWQREGNPPVS
jgi:hypothetical protein